MYYKEAIINNILCWKDTPDGKWIPIDPEKMTRKIVKLELEIKILRDQLEIAKRKVHEPI